jgi:hypothetical protein
LAPLAEGKNVAWEVTPYGCVYSFYIFQRFIPSRIYTSTRINLLSELEAVMLDAIFLCAGLAFFAAAVGYTLICEKL